MDSQDHIKTQQSPGGKSHGAHICTKCGWNYPNPHPSAKTRRAHKKICGTIKGFEILGSEMAKQNLDLQKEHCLDDEQKLPSPRVVEKADERIGYISEEDVFADAVSEFSRSDSFKEKEETATNCMAKSAKNPSETHPYTKSAEVVQESCVVPPVELVDNLASGNQQCGKEPSIEGHSMAFVNLNYSSQVIEGDDTISNVGLDIDAQEDLPDESESKLTSALRKRKDTFDSSWNDEVIYSDVEGPHGFTFEEMSLVHPGEADYAVSDHIPVNTCLKTNADQVISTRQSAGTENADVFLDGTKLEEFEPNRSVNRCPPETPKGEERENDNRSKEENLGIQPEAISIGTEVPSSNKRLLEHKAEPQGQTAVVAVKEYSLVISKSDPEDIKMKADEGESSSGASQESEILKASLPEVEPMVADSNADVNLSDLIGHENELIQANFVAEEGSPISKLSSESSCAIQKYVSPVSVVLEKDNPNDQRKSSPETSIDSILEVGAEPCENNDEAHRGNMKAELREESSFMNVANAKEDPINHSLSTSTAPDDFAETTNQKLLESRRKEFNRVVGGLGIIQADEIDSDVKAHNFYAEVPVTVESNDLRDFGRLQNLSEEHIRSLVSSPLVTRNNTSNAFLGSVSGFSDGVKKPENGSQSSSFDVALLKNQEIIMEKTISWSTVKEQHVPLKNLLSEARSPRLVAAEAKKDHESNIQRVSSILDQETSPEDGCWPERREVSEEWNSPAKYPMELKREDKKVKGRPFWVPFVCCSSVK